MAAGVTGVAIGVWHGQGGTRLCGYGRAPQVIEQGGAVARVRVLPSEAHRRPGEEDVHEAGVPGSLGVEQRVQIRVTKDADGAGGAARRPDPRRRRRQRRRCAKGLLCEGGQPAVLAPARVDA